MRLITLVLLLCSTCFAVIEHRVRSLDGTPYAYKGYSAWLELSHQYYDTYQVLSVDTGTWRITVPAGAALGDGSVVQWFAAPGATLPNIISNHRSYVLCAKSGDTFRLIPGDAGNCQSDPGLHVQFSDVGSGTFYVAQPRGSAGGPYHIYLRNISLPAGVTLGGVICNGLIGCGLDASGYLSYSGTAMYWLKLDISASAPVGTGTINLTVGCSTTAVCADKNLSYPFEVKQLTPVTLAPPTSFPAIPGKATWETQMTARAAQWCDKTTGTIFPNPGALGFGNENGVWYYDGGWVYAQIADYTGEPLWKNCAKTISEWYRNDMFSKNGQYSAFHRTFTDGLKRSCATCDRRGALAIGMIVNNSAVAIAGMGRATDGYIRETAYVVEAALNYARVSGFQNMAALSAAAATIGEPWITLKSKIERGANFSLGHLSLYHSGDYEYMQSFYSGLCMKALISYYDFSGDPRVPVEVKKMVDFLRTVMTISGGTRLVWHGGLPAPGNKAGPKCDYNCYPGDAGDIMNLVIPAYAWLWRITGDDVYRTSGDLLFQHALDNDISYSGKVFSQNFRWSFDYVNWREGRQLNRP